MLEMIHNEELASRPPEPEPKGRSKKKQPKNLHESGSKMMSDPRLFLRKWIGEVGQEYSEYSTLITYVHVI